MVPVIDVIAPASDAFDRKAIDAIGKAHCGPKTAPESCEQFRARTPALSER
jgi:hypothetical protein